MKSKNIALKIAGIIFGIVAALHLARIVTSADLIIAGWEVPMVFSMIALLGSIVLCFWFLLMSGKQQE